MEIRGVGWGPLALVLGLSLAGCAAEEVEPVNRAVLRPNAVALDDETMDALRSVDDRGTLRFSPVTAQAAGLEPGHVVISGITEAAPHGLLRRVSAVRHEGAELVVETEEAMLLEGFKELELSHEYVLGEGHLDPHAPPADGVGEAREALSVSREITVPFDEEVYDFLREGPYRGWPVQVSGYMKLGAGLRLDLTLFDTDELFDDINPFDAVDLSLTASGWLHESFALNLGLPPAAISESSRTVFHQYLQPIQFWAGVWIVLVPRVEIRVFAGGNANIGGTGFGIEQSLDVEVGVRCDLGGCDPWKRFEPDIEAHGPDLADSSLFHQEVHAHGRAGFTVSLDLLLYGIAGPFVEGEPYVELQYDLPGRPAWSLDGGLAARAGIRSVFFGLDWRREIVNQRFNFGRADNAPPMLRSSSASWGDRRVVHLGVPVPFTAETADAEDGRDCCEVLYTSDVDGRLGAVPSGDTLQYTFDTPGMRTVTATARDSDGAEQAISTEVEVRNPPPDVRLFVPEPGTVAYSGVPFLMAGEGTDANEPDGVLACDRMRWTGGVSDDAVPLDMCSATSDGYITATFGSTTGSRTLALTGTDSHGATDSERVTIRVEPPPPGGVAPQAYLDHPRAAQTLQYDSDTVLSVHVLDGDSSRVHYTVSAAWECTSGCAWVPIASGVVDGANVEPGVTVPHGVAPTWVPSSTFPDRLRCGGSADVSLRIEAWGDGESRSVTVTTVRRVMVPPC